MGFADNLKKNIQSVQHQVNNSIVETAQQFGNKLLDYSPLGADALYMGAYAKGLFINSWYVGENNFDPTVGTSPDPSGSASKSRISGLKGSQVFLNKDGYISFSNNLSYAYRVEVLGWPSGTDSVSGWSWTGSVGPYAPVRNSITYMQGVKKQ